MANINVREDFRRDGLAANFLVTPRTIGLLSNAIPSSKINIGYPGICSEEYAACKKILDSNLDSSAELCLTGHARLDHIKIMSKLIENHSNSSANIWIPISDYFIKNTFNMKPEEILKDVVSLIDTWYTMSNHPLDLALTDITANESDLISRLDLWTNKFLDKGIRKIILCDTRGIGNPIDMRKIFSQLNKYSDSLEFHPHNDLGRAKQTCNIILRNHKNVPIHYDSRLRERHYGKYQGLTGSDLHKAVRKSGKTFIEFKPKSGESVLDQYSRVKDFLDELLKKHRNETILVVTHGGVMTNMLLYITKDSHDNFKKYHPPNAAITLLKSTNNDTRIHKLNYIKHLKDF